MKRIAFDLRCLPSDGSPGAGISHAARELWEACLLQEKNFSLECVGFSTITNTSHHSKDLEQKKLVAVKASGHSLRSALKKHPCHAFFAPSGAIPLGVNIPTFPWVHDVAIFQHPEWFPQSWLRRKFTTNLFLCGLKRARHVFCVSEDTRQAVSHLTSLPASRLSVTYEGVTSPLQIKPFQARENMVVIFGTVEPRKNIPFIIDLWPDVCRGLERPAKLIIAGKTGWGNVKIQENNYLQRIERISDAERDALLSKAKIVLVPSLHEGFGRVALEAMAQGTPVIVSRVGAHAEIVEKAGLALDPQDKQAWVRGISTMLFDHEQWHALHMRGQERARKFRWETVARHILAGIRENC